MKDLPYHYLKRYGYSYLRGEHKKHIPDPMVYNGTKPLNALHLKNTPKYLHLRENAKKIKHDCDPRFPI
jgi:hypothetical protein